MPLPHLPGTDDRSYGCCRRSRMRFCATSRTHELREHSAFDRPLHVSLTIRTKLSFEVLGPFPCDCNSASTSSASLSPSSKAATSRCARVSVSFCLVEYIFAERPDTCRASTLPPAKTRKFCSPFGVRPAPSSPSSRSTPVQEEACPGSRLVRTACLVATQTY